MDTLDNYRHISKEVLVPYTQIPYSHAASECKAVFDSAEDGVTYELVAAGIPKEKIVLGFHPPNVRQHTGYAVA
ncbi:hypothetical protein NSTC745_00980 [Nostoc sp. DSM 114161]|jgi:hypothetical protein|uniref:element excision factor XisI family protein n=1 Tax=Nostoc sp. DSM 114161 TaxID=3440143 RepID=UPI00404554C9